MSAIDDIVEYLAKDYVITFHADQVCCSNNKKKIFINRFSFLFDDKSREMKRSLELTAATAFKTLANYFLLHPIIDEAIMMTEWQKVRKNRTTDF